MKILLIIFVVLIGIYFGYQQFEYYYALRLSKQTLIPVPTPATTVFAFDFNQVVVMADFAKIGSILWHEVPKTRILLFLLNPLRWFYIIKAGIKQRRIEFILKELIRVYPDLTHLQPLYHKLFEAVDLNKKVIAIIQKLKKAGYPCYILSNIGPEAYEGIKEKFPILQTLFDGFFLATSVDDMTKPEQVFYTKFKKYIVDQGHEHKQIIFIDNDATNIIAATQYGLKGILFTTADKLAAALFGPK